MPPPFRRPVRINLFIGTSIPPPPPTKPVSAVNTPPYLTNSTVFVQWVCENADVWCYVCGVVGWRGGVGRQGDRVSLLVRNFSKFTNRVGIRRIFGRFGEISDVYIPRFFFKSSSTSFSLRLLHFCVVSGSVFLFLCVGGRERLFKQIIKPYLCSKNISSCTLTPTTHTPTSRPSCALLACERHACVLQRFLHSKTKRVCVH